MLLAATVALGGCSYNRVNEVRNQFCDFDSNFSYSIEQPMEFVFRQPVLLDSDVRLFLGTQPTEIVSTENGEVHRYVIDKVRLDETFEEAFAVDLHYRKQRDNLRLQAVALAQGLDNFDWFNTKPELEEIAETAARICASGMTLGLLSREEDIDPRYLQALPTRRELLSLLGEPTFESEQENALIYEYRLRGASQDPVAARLVVWFDEAGVRPLQLVSRYRGMQSRADLIAGKVRYSLRI